MTTASVEGTIKHLANNDPRLLNYRKHHGVELTLKGKAAALEIICHHRLIEPFLHQSLGYAWDEVHSEEDSLEHVISEKLEKHILIPGTHLTVLEYSPYHDNLMLRIAGQGASIVLGLRVTDKINIEIIKLRHLQTNTILIRL